MKFFEIFKKKEISRDPLTLENLVEMGLISKAEMLLIKKERATREWEEETGFLRSEKRSHHKKH